MKNKYETNKINPVNIYTYIFRIIFSCLNPLGLKNITTVLPHIILSRMIIYIISRARKAAVSRTQDPFNSSGIQIIPNIANNKKIE